MKKRWLVKINGEDNLYYNSKTKDYRLRLFCPHCKKPSTCYCYQSYEDYEEEKISELPVMYCSSMCCILVGSDDWKNKVLDAANHIGIGNKPLIECTEKEAEKIIDYIVDKHSLEPSEDYYGEQCET